MWTSADKWREQQGPAKTPDEMRRQGNERARVVLDTVEDPAALLTDPDRAVLAHAAPTALAHNSRGKALDRVAAPRAEMLARTGLGLTALRTTLGRLEGRGLLALVEHGLRRGPRAGKPGRANVYALPEPEAVQALLPEVPENRSVVPPAHLCGAPPPDQFGAPAHLCGAPADNNTEVPEDDQMVTMTVSAGTAAQLPELLRGLSPIGTPETVRVEPAPALD